MAEQLEPTTKKDVLELIQDEWNSLQAALGKLTEAQMLAPGLEGERSVKDILAHISAWEQKMIQWLRESYADQTPQRPAPGLTWNDLDQVNAQIFVENHERSLGEILAAFQTTSAQAIQAILAMTDRDLFDGSRFDWRNGDPIWHMVAANTWWHYKEHREQIEAWI